MLFASTIKHFVFYCYFIQMLEVARFKTLNIGLLVDYFTSCTTLACQRNINFQPFMQFSPGCHWWQDLIP
jgi:hypothetical protein